MLAARFDSDVTADELSDVVQEQGYAIVEGMLTPAQVAAALDALAPLFDETPTGRNDFEGFHTQRIYALFGKTRALDDAALHPLLLGVLDRVLRHYQFSAPVALRIGPGEAAQMLHRDEDVYPIPRPHPPVVLNTMWALCDFTVANGATRLIPGSHRWAPDRRPEESETVAAEMPAGSVLFYLGGLWHGGGANTTGNPRPGVILEFAAAWLRPQETNLLAVPPAIARGLPERLQELVGYNVFPPFLGYVDGRHPRRLLQRGDGSRARPKPG